MVYSTIIKPTKDENSNAGIIINIENSNVNNNFWIGKDINSEEELKQLMIKNIKSDSIDINKTTQILDTIKNSRNWKKEN